MHVLQMSGSDTRAMGRLMGVIWCDLSGTSAMRRLHSYVSFERRRPVSFERRRPVAFFAVPRFAISARRTSLLYANVNWAFPTNGGRIFGKFVFFGCFVALIDF